MTAIQEVKGEWHGTLAIEDLANNELRIKALAVKVWHLQKDQNNEFKIDICCNFTKRVFLYY